MHIVRLLYMASCVLCMLYNVFSPVNWILFVDDDDETATNSESVVSKSHLSELCSEAAKLKSMGVMNQVLLLNTLVLFTGGLWIVVIFIKMDSEILWKCAVYLKTINKI